MAVDLHEVDRVTAGQAVTRGGERIGREIDVVEGVAVEVLLEERPVIGAEEAGPHVDLLVRRVEALRGEAVVVEHSACALDDRVA